MTAPVSDLDWRQRGACKDENPDLFFRDSKRGIKQAKAVCAGCPVAGKCLTWALETVQGWGVAGGLDADERQALRRAAGRAA